MAGLPEQVCQLAADKSQALEEADQKTINSKRNEQTRKLLARLSQASSSDDTQIVQYAQKLVHQ